jgi:hypothetical protein
MKKCKRAWLGTYVLTFWISGILFVLLSALPTALLAKDQLSVTQEKDKTVYSIDSSERTRRQDMEDRDRAWEMLNRMPIILDKRQNQTVPVTPTQPSPAK